MKKALVRGSLKLFHVRDGKEIDGKNEKMIGDCSNLRGNCSGLRGDCSELWGNLNDCDLTEEERKKGVEISDLVKE